MRTRLASVAAIAVFPTFVAVGNPSAARASSLHGGARNVQVPFVENRGQLDDRVAFAAPTFFGSAFVTRDGMLVYSLPARRPGHGGAGSTASSDGWTLTETLVAGRPAPAAARTAATRVSLFHGSDPACWVREAPTFDEISFGEVWPGVEMSLHARQGNVEKVFTVAAGSSVGSIRLRVGGASDLQAASDGSLVVRTEAGDVRFSRPVAYQESGGARRAVDVAYEVHGSTYGFRVGDRDPELPVVIDPLVQSSYLGGQGNDFASALAIHPSSGEVLVAGSADSLNFPGITGGVQPFLNSFYSDAYVARLDPTLTTLLQATYLGGTFFDVLWGLAVDPSSGDVLIAGTTSSTDLPGTAGGAQAAHGGGMNDAFLARLGPALTTLVQATYLGGTGDLDSGEAITLDPTTGEILLSGGTNSADFPGTSGGAQESMSGESDAFTARLDPGLTTLLQATYLGGTGFDTSATIVAHPTSGEVFVGGNTSSTDFPATAGGAQATGFGHDAWVARLNSALTANLQSTYLGGSAGLDAWVRAAIHPSTGEVIVAGKTFSGDFPGTLGGAQATLRGGWDAFVARLNPALTSLLQATYLGGTDEDGAAFGGIGFDDPSGDILVSGNTTSTDFPGTAGGAQPSLGGGLADGFVARLNSSLTTLVQATYLGGIGTEGGTGIDHSCVLAVDPSSGDVFVAGATSSTDFPARAGGAQEASGGASWDAFVARLTPNLAGVLAGRSLEVDAAASSAPAVSDGNGLLEPGETVTISPTWANGTLSGLSPTGTASAFSGPPVATYSIPDDAADYGTIAAGESAECAAAANCYELSVSAVTGRPTHVDASFTESLSTGEAKTWTLHIGDSFPDVPRGDLFYRFIENLLHNGVTGGCGGNNYCPSSSVTRAQMAVFLLKSKYGPSHVPGSCRNMFPDVACPGPFADWIEELAALSVTAGCGGGKYCPDSPVTRKQMAVFLLKAKEGGLYQPPGPAGIFGDLEITDNFTAWIEELYNRQITGGCQANPLLYCPDNPNTRGQMAVFLVKTFGLQLYGS